MPQYKLVVNHSSKDDREVSKSTINVDGEVYVYYVANSGAISGPEHLNPALDLAKTAIHTDREVKKSLLEGMALTITVDLEKR